MSSIVGSSTTYIKAPVNKVSRPEREKETTEKKGNRTWPHRDMEYTMFNVAYR
jgi:hypothetical protein